MEMEEVRSLWHASASCFDLCSDSWLNNFSKQFYDNSFALITGSITTNTSIRQLGHNWFVFWQHFTLQLSEGKDFYHSVWKTIIKLVISVLKLFPTPSNFWNTSSNKLTFRRCYFVQSSVSILHSNSNIVVIEKHRSWHNQKFQEQFQTLCKISSKLPSIHKSCWNKFQLRLMAKVFKNNSQTNQQLFDHENQFICFPNHFNKFKMLSNLIGNYLRRVNDLNRIMIMALI